MTIDEMEKHIEHISHHYQNIDRIYDKLNKESDERLRMIDKQYRATIIRTIAYLLFFGALTIVAICK